MNFDIVLIFMGENGEMFKLIGDIGFSWEEECMLWMLFLIILKILSKSRVFIKLMIDMVILKVMIGVFLVWFEMICDVNEDVLWFGK